MKRNQNEVEGRVGVMMCIPLSAKLNLPLSELASLLKNYPLLEQVQTGSELVYLAKSGGVSHTFHFGKTYILHKINSANSPIYSMRESLLRLLGMVTFLQEAYEVKPESIFPYLIAELSKPELNLLAKNLGQSRNGNPEIILSKRIIELLLQLGKISKENSELGSTRLRLLSYLLLKESERGSVLIKEFCEKYSLEVSELSSVEKTLSGLGFRLLLGGGKINLVKT